MFEFIQPICIGDPYQARAGAVKRVGFKPKEGQPNFRPGGPHDHGPGQGQAEWVPSGEPKVERREKVLKSFEGRIFFLSSLLGLEVFFRGLFFLVF